MGDRYGRRGLAQPGDWRRLLGRGPPQLELSPFLAGIGHNGGPPIEPPRPSLAVRYAWRQAHAAAWRNPPLDILRFRVARAKAAGVSYREYMLVLLDTGRHLQAGDG